MGHYLNKLPTKKVNKMTRTTMFMSGVDDEDFDNTGNGVLFM